MSKIMATPAAKRVAAEKKIPLEKVKPTGVTGYVQLSDILSFKGLKSTYLARAVADFYDVDIENVQSTKGKITKEDVLAYAQGNKSTIIPLTAMRKTIATRMKESLSTAPQYTNHGEVCAYALKNFLKEFAPVCIEKTGVKPTFSDLLIKAVALALRKNMMMNSSFMDTHIEIHGHINVGLAVALEGGLIVPNIKNPDRLTLEEIAVARQEIVEKARGGKLLPEEYTGGTFTISNMGGYPVEYFTPIINLPESAILGVGTITQKVVPIDGNIGIRPMLGLSLTSDHRHIDGAVSGQFMQDLKEIIENPQELM